MLHGGDTLSYKKYYKGELLDFSSNINPLGPPKGLNKRLIEGFDTFTAYPDIEYRKLKSKIAGYLECDVENILVGNGAMEIIDNFIMMADSVITTTPAFAEYSLRAKVHNKELKIIPYDKDFSLDLDIIDKNLKENDLLVLGNPNNPTGLRIEKEKLLKLYNMVKDRQAYLLLDEAFFEFAPDDYDSVKLFKEDGYKNIAIIRAATKFFGIPGLRLGYACGSKEKVKELNSIKLPWSVNTLADIAGQYIFDNTDYIEESRKYIDRERKYLLDKLNRYDFIKPMNTQTNYILIKLKKYDEDIVFDYFVRRGIVIRKCSSFNGLDSSYIRIAIKSREDNKKLIKVFDELNKENL